MKNHYIQSIFKEGINSQFYMNTSSIATATRIIQQYKEHFGTSISPRLFRSPGRINLIGEHTDYNDGFVMPAAIDKAIYFAIAPREDDQIILHSADFEQTYTTTIDALSHPSIAWPKYQLGVVEQLQKQGHTIKGFQATFGGDVPSGAGLSSSAALECCLMFALSSLNNLGLDKKTIAVLSQKAENEYVGLNCGIMDQFASVFGKTESVIRIDCRTLEHTYFPFSMDEYIIVLCDTTVKHSLADSAYNTRRQECEQGVALINALHHSEHSSLRDIPSNLVEQYKEQLGDVIYRRCKYVTTEIERVQQASLLLEEGNLLSFGQKMYETHKGLQHDYEVSCPELDFLVAATESMTEVIGARMMGGGFGGCTINLVKRSEAQAFEEKIKQLYQAKFAIELPCYQVSITDGTSELISY